MTQANETLKRFILGCIFLMTPSVMACPVGNEITFYLNSESPKGSSVKIMKLSTDSKSSAPESNSSESEIYFLEVYRDIQLNGFELFPTDHQEQFKEFFGRDKLPVAWKGVSKETRGKAVVLKYQTDVKVNDDYNKSYNVRVDIERGVDQGKSKVFHPIAFLNNGNVSGVKILYQDNKSKIKFEKKFALRSLRECTATAFESPVR